MKFTRTDANQIMNNFKEIGIRTKLIGSIKNKGISKNDIDLVLLDYPMIDDKLILKIQTQFIAKSYTITNWGGIFIETYSHEKIDLFPNTFMRKCYHCKKKCCY